MSEERFNVSEDFGCNVFNDAVMRERLPKHIYKSMKNTIEEGTALDDSVAEVVASAMKDWALDKGATHYTHWFQPMTGITAEKHDSFITPSGDGRALMDFSGKELIKGEPDASSFPSGGIRSTFEARGYTAWDPTSYAFVKDSTLYIPTAFCSYTGEVLDKKTPLLRSMQVINQAALKILRLCGNTTATRVNTTVGAEQEYFLIKKELYEQRRDLILTGRTLFGAKPPKGQEMDDHYFGNIKDDVKEYMKDLDEELWKLGIYSKTEHNEVAPSQHELAPLFGTTNLATDHNQLTMGMMKKVAPRHGFACLLHEKPFAGVNGSGKHNNWSMATNDGQNLLSPGKDPANNLQFLLFFCAVIEAVDQYADLLRVTVATAGNDHRLGANEAPPAIVSMFIGDDLQKVLDDIVHDHDTSAAKRIMLENGVETLPNIRKDSTDRNRTSPLAFTGNKFEFRMLGSRLSISGPNIILNTIVAESLEGFADRLEYVTDFKKEVYQIVKDTVKNHGRIIFNGNNYSDEWVEEAERRGLHNFKSTVDALPAFVEPKSIELFSKHGVFSEVEIRSRYEILLEDYSKTINIEALTMVDMSRKQIIPAIMEFVKAVCDTLAAKKCLGIEIDGSTEENLAKKVSSLEAQLAKAVDQLETDLSAAKDIEEAYQNARYYHDVIFADMQSLRAVADELETMVGEDFWPFPTYADLLF